MKHLSLSDFKITVKYPVHWGNMDAANHVNNLIYLRWSESARLDYFIQMGMDVSFSGDAVGPILGWQECKYIFPMRYPDTAIVGTRTLEVKADRFVLEAAIFSEQHNRLAAICRQDIVPYDYQGLKRAEMPAAWVEAIEGLEG